MRTNKVLVYRQTVWTRVTHWSWAVAMFFLLMSGLQIFNAHPILYLGEESGFDYNNRIFALGTPADPTIPGWLTLPSGRDLATGRVVHFFFAWIFVAVLLIWAAAGILTGHVKNDLVPRGRDMRALGRDIKDHLQLKLHHTRRYGPMQKLTYGAVLFGLFPLMIFTGLAMSPGANAALPWLTEVFGGRQTARSLHFFGMAAIVGFVVVHLLMVILAGPLNEMRSMITGYYRADEGEQK